MRKKIFWNSTVGDFIFACWGIPGGFQNSYIFDHSRNFTYGTLLEFHNIEDSRIVTLFVGLRFSHYRPFKKTHNMDPWPFVIFHKKLTIFNYSKNSLSQPFLILFYFYIIITFRIIQEINIPDNSRTFTFCTFSKNLNNWNFCNRPILDHSIIFKCQEARGLRGLPKVAPEVTDLKGFPKIHDI